MATRPQRQVLAEVAYELIRRRLVDHEIPPGSRMNINTLAAELDVSPTPLREALARLEAEGLVVKRSLAGYAAAPLLGPRDLDELFDVRLLLEPAVAARAADRTAPGDLVRLAGTLAETEAARDDGSRESMLVYLRNDAAFHDGIAALGGNALLRTTLCRLHAHAHQYRLFFRAGMARATLVEHERILQALRERDADTAAARMRTHLRRARERLAGAVGDDHARTGA
ncbi:GntR family transcriptional regulator [Streptomyces marincola]|uniref:GntR family transcriptional regulator n=1 Tax=Streptomyces marincola TaxID=2878388 RepID=UPI001CF478F8|nr:GntR family transcriptional regulator [Streptomyces marincola]UCM91433.1 GntR family transcriptional regulator [Streptomyces marincola]